MRGDTLIVIHYRHYFPFYLVSLDQIPNNDKYRQPTANYTPSNQLL